MAGLSEQRIGQPIAEHARAHGGCGAVEHGQQRALAIAVAQRASELQAAARRLVDFQPVGGRVMLQSIDVGQRAFLRFDQILEHRAGRPDRRGRLAVEAEPLERQGAKMPGQRLVGRLRGEGPGRPAGDQNPPGRSGDLPAAVVGQQAFGRSDPGQLVGQPIGRKASGLKAARGKIDPGDAGHPATPGRVTVGRRIGRGRHHGGQVVAGPWVEQGIVGDRAGTDDTGQLAFDQPFGLFGVFDLFANGGPQSGGDQLAQVAFQLVIGKAGHRNGVGPLFAAGQRQVEHPGGRLGVVVKHLIEIPHAKQQDRVRAGRLGIQVLLHHRGGHGEARNSERGTRTEKGGSGPNLAVEVVRTAHAIKTGELARSGPASTAGASLEIPEPDDRQTRRSGRINNRGTQSGLVSQLRVPRSQFSSSLPSTHKHSLKDFACRLAVIRR